MLNSESATCWGSFNWQKLLNVIKNIILTLEMTQESENSSTANGMHTFKMMVVHSPLFTFDRQEPLKVCEKEGGFCRNGCIHYLGWAKLWNTQHWNWDQTQTTLEETSALRRDCCRKTAGQWVSLILVQFEHWLEFEFSKCYLLGRLNMTNATDCKGRLVSLESHSDHLKWSHWWLLCS